MTPEEFKITIEQDKVLEVKRRANYTARNYTYIKAYVHKYGAKASFYPHNKLVKFLRSALMHSELFSFPATEVRVQGILVHRPYGG